MKRTKLWVGALFVLLALGAGVVLAQQRPPVNINPKRHAALAAAQQLAAQAWDKITEAQQYNKYDMKGHASKAKALLVEANKELDLAAAAANEGKPK